MGCNCRPTVAKTAVTASMFKLTGGLEPGDEVEVRLRQGGHPLVGTVRRVYLDATATEMVDVRLTTARSVVTVRPSKGDQITVLAAVSS